MRTFACVCWPVYANVCLNTCISEYECVFFLISMCVRTCKTRFMYLGFNGVPAFERVAMTMHIMGPPM